MKLDFERIGLLLHVAEKATQHGSSLTPIVQAAVRELREFSVEYHKAQIEEDAKKRQSPPQAAEPAKLQVGEPELPLEPEKAPETAPHNLEDNPTPVSRDSAATDAATSSAPRRI